MHHKPLIILSLALTLLVSFDYLAAWTVPPSNPPSGNIAAPLNTGSINQIKNGSLGVNTLNAYIGSLGGGIVRAENQMRANQYCDLNGANCTSTLGGGGGGITSLSAGTGIVLSANPLTTSGSISANTTILQRRITGTCPAGQAIRAIDANGNATCQAVTGSTCLWKGQTFSQGASCRTGTDTCSVGYARHTYQTCSAGGVWVMSSYCSTSGSIYATCP